MQKINPVSMAVALCLSISALPVVAEEAKKDTNRIVITGSHIKRLEQESSSPLAVLSADYISRSGATTLSELLQTTVFSNGASLNNQQTGGFTPGASSFNLRGLRADRTLVLVDGKRLPSYPFGQNGNVAFVDLNTIPLAEIERVEILKDGASAVYGSDAIAGVVNIITKQEFHGSEIVAKTTQSNSNYANNFISYLGGYSSDDSEFIFVAEYQKFDALLGNDTDFANTLAFDEANIFSFPGTYITYDPTVTATPAPGCETTASASDLGYSIEGDFCVNDWAADRQLLPENERKAISVKWNKYIGDSTVYINLSANQTDTNSDVPFGLVSLPALSIPAGYEFNPIGEDFDFYRGFSEIGLQNIQTTANNYKVVAGLNGLIGEYDFDLAFNHGLTQIDEVYAKGWMSYDNMNNLYDAIFAGDINMFSPLSQEQIDTYTSQFNHKGKSYQTALAFKLSGELTDWENGTVYFASGVEFRKEFISDTSDQDILDGNVVGLGNSSAEGEREISSLFGEFILPATEALEFNLALRYDDYSDFGSSVNPKASLKYKANENLLLRASWGTGFRAPNLFELNSQASGSVGNISFISVGNKELDAESSESFNIGLVADFEDSYMITLDAWQIKVDDMISNLGVNTILTAQDDNGDLLYSDLIVLNPDNSISYVVDPYLNIDSQESQGIDLSFKLALSRTLDWNISVTHLTKLEQTNGNSVGDYDSAGEYLFPKNRFNSSLKWTNGNLSQTVMAYYVGTHGSEVAETEGVTKFDYQANYQLDDHNISLMVTNLTDEQAPVNNALSWPYYEQRMYSPLGRTYSLQWKYAF
jgi:outer membrane receptor protein involved in Fe transport